MQKGKGMSAKSQLSSKRLPNYAIGAEEAAAIMGLHRSQPKKMWAKGLLSCRVLSVHETREFVVFSLRECMENWDDYWEGRTSKESGRGRPRTREDEHDTALDRLLSTEAQIDYYDAICPTEAAALLGVWHSRVSAMSQDGLLSCRVLWSEAKSGKPRLNILSEKEVRKLAEKHFKLENSGEKKGRPRSKDMYE